MSNAASTTNQELARLGLEWLKPQRDKLVERYNSKLTQLTISVSTSPGSAKILNLQLERLASLQVDGMIRRLEGNPFLAEELKNVISQILEQGIGMEDLIRAADELFTILAVKIEHETTLPPQVAEVFLKKVEYIIHLIKSTIGAAIIYYQPFKPEITNL